MTNHSSIISNVIVITPDNDGTPLVVHTKLAIDKNLDRSIFKTVFEVRSQAPYSSEQYWSHQASFLLSDLRNWTHSGELASQTIQEVALMAVLSLGHGNYVFDMCGQFIYPHVISDMNLDRFLSIVKADQTPMRLLNVGITPQTLASAL